MTGRQNWQPTLVIALVGIGGALLGYVAQSFLSIWVQRSRAFEERQRDAYSAFSKAFEKSHVAQRLRYQGHCGAAEGADENKCKQAREVEAAFDEEALAAARQIALFGKREVVSAMAHWFLTNPEGIDRCTRELEIEFAMWQRMRQALLGRSEKVTDEDLAAIATRCKLRAVP